MFKERIKIVGKKVCYGLLQVFLLILTFALIGGLIVLVTEYPTLKTIVGYIVYSMIGLVALVFTIVVIFSTYEFIQWLFVEPYKEKKKMKS